MIKLIIFSTKFSYEEKKVLNMEKENLLGATLVV